MSEYDAEIAAARAAGERAAMQRARMIVQGENARLAPLFESAGLEQQTPEQVVYGHAPGYGPELEAQRLEGLAGSYDVVPGWWSARQFAEAGASNARQSADRVLSGLSRKGVPYNRAVHREAYDEEFRKNRHLLSRPQFEYMQEVGRNVDLLRNLRDESWRSGPGGMKSPAQAAVEYWDKSNPVHNPGAIRAREDFNDPNYQRFAGASKGVQSFFQNPDSPLVQWFQVGQVMPNSMRHAWESPGAPAGDSLQRAANTRAFMLGHMLNGENPVVRAPQPANPNDSEAWAQALSGAGVASQNLQPPPWQNIANAGWRAVQHAAQSAAGIEQPVVSNATAAAGDLLGILGDAIDPTLAAGAVAGLPARTRLLAQLAASQGRSPAPLASRLARATAGQAYQEGVPEVALSGALNTIAGDPSRTVVDYLTKPVDDIPLDSAARSEAHRQEELRNLNEQQSIPEERRKAYYRHLPGGKAPGGLW